MSSHGNFSTFQCMNYPGGVGGGGECGIHYFSTKNSTSESKVASGSLSSCPDMGSQHSQQLFPSYRCLESKGDQ